MSPTLVPETILAHPALAGRTLFIRADGGWAAFEIQSEGRLSQGRPAERDPAATAWRGAPSR
jgi:hypothetical protein